jgi:CubicO group peptidase (beta-lactamase class C family)
MNVRAALLCVFFFTAPAFAQETALPDTFAARQLGEWLRVFARGDQDAYTTFISERYAKALLVETSAAYRAGLAGRMFLDAHAFAIRVIERSTQQEIAVLAQSTLTGLWYRLTMTVEADAPHRITAYGAQRIQPPNARKLGPGDLIKEIERFVKTISDADAFSGAILIARDGKTVYSAAHGWASEEYRTSVNLDTKFNIASIGKNFTAVAIEQLHEAGKLSLDDNVGKYLPDYPSADVREKVTLRHLLTHTSGLGDIYSPKYECLKASLREVSDYFPLFADDPKPLAFTPGERWQYSNIGYIILGRIIEVVSGENFFDYVRNHVFKPAGLRNTDYFAADIDTPNRATGYTHFVDQGNNNYEFHLGQKRNTLLRATVRGNPQGGALATAPDLLRYTNALKSGKLISAGALAEMTTPKVEARKIDAAITYWGYGFEIETIGGQRVLGHTGGDFGVSSVFRLYPDSGNYTVIVLSNTDRGGQIAIYKIQELILSGKSLTP